MFISKSNLKTEWEKYLKELNERDLSYFSNDALEKALEKEMDRAMKKEGNEALQKLVEVWESSMEGPDPQFGYFIDIGMTKRALKAGSIKIAEWILTSAPHKYISEATGEREQMVKLLQLSNAIDSIIRVCYKSSQYLDRYLAAEALIDLKGNDSITILRDVKKNLKGEDKIMLQSTIAMLKKSLDARKAFTDKKRNEESMRLFVQDVILKSNPTLDEINMSFKYLEEHPDLISGFKRMSTLEKLREKKEEIKK